MGEEGSALPRVVDLRSPRWDQSTFWGRARHFFAVTDPRNLLLSSHELEQARSIVTDFRAGYTHAELSEEDWWWHAKYAHDSAFHPETGEKMLLIGRMSAQVPANMTITGCMLTFYRSTPAVVFWQWINQSFNAIVNFTNRSGVAPISTMQLASAYICATSGAVATALALKSLAKTLPPIMGRLVPFAAVAAANCINVPFMRQRELMYGGAVADEHGVCVSESRIAARSAIAQVVFSRVCMALPAMAIPPVIMNMLEKRPLLKRMPWIGAPVPSGLGWTLCLLISPSLVFATPLCCALFPQNSSMPVSRLEPEVREEIWSKNPKLCVVFFNKGL
uniref:Sidoreflexin n=1 Tax=Petromyzon marinus TaxID=7757 RepID=S4RFI2_PETMA